MTANRVLLDSNLLLLFVVGHTSKSLIAKHRRLHPVYGSEHFDLLLGMLGGATQLLATTNILTETSNLMGLTAGNDRQRLFVNFRIFLQNIEIIDEIHIPSNIASERAEFVRLGLTDSAILVDQKDEFTLLTADGPLYVAALNAGRKAINFNHLRDQN